MEKEMKNEGYYPKESPVVSGQRQERFVNRI